MTPPCNDSLLDINNTLSFNNTECYEPTTRLLTAGRGGDNFNLVVSIVVGVLFAVTTAAGIFGNVLVILVITFNKTMKNSTNYLVVNLAFADLFFVLIVVPFTAVKYTTSYWQFGDLWCKIMNYMGYVCAWASAYTLVLMSFDRVMAIVFAIRSRNIRSKRNTMIAIIVVWVVVSLANIPAWLFHGEVEYSINNVDYKTCKFLNIPEKVDEVSALTFHFSYFVFGFMLPVLAITILYSVLIAFLMSRKSPAGSSTAAKTKKRVTCMIITVVVVFIVCWLPIQIILVMTNMKVYPRKKEFVALQIGANCLAYMNSCMNPLLYTISSSTFRKAFKEFLCCSTCSFKSIFLNSIKSNNNSRKSSKMDSPEVPPDAEERNSFLGTTQTDVSS